MATVPTLNDIIKAITESLKVCRRFFKVFFFLKCSTNIYTAKNKEGVPCTKRDMKT